MPDPVPFHTPSAADAWNRIETHEQVCAQRYGNLTSLIADHKAETGRRFDDLNKGVTRVMWAVAGGGVALIGYLLVLVIPGLKP